ncbi:unnamed protein product [Somion occarium]|uniref:Uncharacterized protein n=1 Tax=Somion occarium TaxID=3059160 RepID=A0ABP1DZU1_9APHY
MAVRCQSMTTSAPHYAPEVDGDLSDRSFVGIFIQLNNRHSSLPSPIVLQPRYWQSPRLAPPCHHSSALSSVNAAPGSSGHPPQMSLRLPWRQWCLRGSDWLELYGISRVCPFTSIRLRSRAWSVCIKVKEDKDGREQREPVCQ